jgi:hypothetical protein
MHTVDSAMEVLLDHERELLADLPDTERDALVTALRSLLRSFEA